MINMSLILAIYAVGIILSTLAHIAEVVFFKLKHEFMQRQEGTARAINAQPATSSDMIEVRMAGKNKKHAGK